ncbi:MAG: CpXC domain-containing protein [Anaerolineales bacterium]|nr:CpXC domain-containing protein [Anaerolineales bacterium]MCS7248578.1 CpXC domain-containing protein [Anaerolineales bacterium]MDW8162391.1 CpXC domain-containing protein [Anaerolineales bacterium]MDW8447724.1 CpXC domain-containing protein [Anaerolineales bacterium]
MPISYSQTIPLTCPQCGQNFHAEFWLILDAGERPDLLAQAREGTLNTVTCPGCGAPVTHDAPSCSTSPPLSLWERGQG